MDTAGCATLEISGRLGGWDHFGRAVGNEQLEDKAEGQGGGWGAGSSDGIFAILYLMPNQLLALWHVTSLDGCG